MSKHIPKKPSVYEALAQRFSEINMPPEFSAMWPKVAHYIVNESFILVVQHDGKPGKGRIFLVHPGFAGGAAHYAPDSKPKRKRR